MWHHRGATRYPSVAWGIHPCGITNHEDTRKSPPFHHDAQLVYPLHHHTLRGIPMDSS
jgi:hypothetical protein